MTKTPLHVVALVSLFLGVGTNICRAEQADDEKGNPQGG
jgi:hypothetical protein